MIPDTLLEISRCPEVSRCLQSTSNHPCNKIVQSQSVNSLDEFQVPEPWSGQIQSAPILFISSNPSIGEDEIFPRGNWSDEDIVDYFQKRFGGGKTDWVINGNKSLRKVNTYGRATMFWAGVKARANELLEREPVPGFDYALSELVHCKSRQEMGVPEALDRCVALYLRKVMAVSGARILVGLGSLAKQVLSREFNLPPNIKVVGPFEICNKERMVTFLPHPNAWKDKTFQKVVTESELQELRKYLSKGAI